MRRRLLRWFARHGRSFYWRDDSIRLTRFQVLLTEFLLWKTSAARAHALIRELVLRHPEPAAVLATTADRLQRQLRPLGLHVRRTRCLIALSRELVERHGGRVPATVPELQALTGIGQYAARATACMLEGSRLMPVDVNTSRIFGRLFGEEGPGVRQPGAAWDARLDAFVPRRQPRRFLWAIMDLAALACTPRDPACPTCPLRGECATGRARLGPEHP